MEYKEVENGHIVPAGYLRGFAKGSMIVRHVVTLKHEKERREKTRSVKAVGTRKRPYSRTRPRDGTRIDDVEDSISKLENQVEVVRKARHRFPYCEGDRSTVAQFAGAQQVRGPKWAREYEGLVDAAKADAERGGMSAAEAEHDARIMRSDTQRLISMQRWLYGFSSLFFAMRWTLVEFARPVLITCDHPVVLWDAANLACAPIDLSGTGVKDLLEVRYPLSSTTCLLMTWLPGGDDPVVVRGNKVLARNINSFTRAAAEDEWFYLPDTKPPFSDGRSRLLPLSTQIYGEYAHGQITDRRQLGMKLAFETKEQPLQNTMSFEAYYPGSLPRCERTGCSCQSTTP
jgi:hypothetical protein